MYGDHHLSWEYPVPCRGAGRKATASAVVSDIVDVARNIASNSIGRVKCFTESKLFNRLVPMDEIKSRYYLRLTVEDTPGVMAQITAILAENNINISSLIQHENNDCNKKSVSVILFTSIAQEKAVQKAVTAIENLSSSLDKVKLLRIEDI